MEQVSQISEQSNLAAVNKESYKLTDQKGQISTVRLLLMDQEYVRFQVVISRTCWQIDINQNEAFKIHNMVRVNNSIEEIFQYFDNCFKAKQVSLKTENSLAHLTFDQVVVFDKQVGFEKHVVFKITLNKIDLKIEQIVDDMFIEQENMATKVEEISSKSEERLTQLEEKLQKALDKIQILEEERHKMQQISQILMNHEKNLLYNWLSEARDDVVSHLDLLYRASDHGFQAESFIQRCDGKGPLVCFVRSEKQRRFGGYIHLTFQKNLNEKVAANPNESFLFSLDDGKKYLSNEADCRCVYYSGSKFGFTMGDYDLRLSDNCNKNYGSYSNLSNTYGKKQDGNDQSLAGSRYFLVDEVEVFQVIYKQSKSNTRTIKE